MRLRCPACGSEASLDVLVAHSEASQALHTALSMTPLGRLLVQYLALFRPAKSSLSFARVHKILSEVLAMVEAGTIERKGSTWPAPQAYWTTALEQMLARRASLNLPLDGHGYLLSIIAGFGEKAAAAAETAREEQRKHNPEGVRSSALPSDGDDFERAQRTEAAKAQALEDLAKLRHKMNISSKFGS